MDEITYCDSNVLVKLEILDAFHGFLKANFDKVIYKLILDMGEKKSSRSEVHKTSNRLPFNFDISGKTVSGNLIANHTSPHKNKKNRKYDLGNKFPYMAEEEDLDPYDSPSLGSSPRWGGISNSTPVGSYKGDSSNNSILPPQHTQSNLSSGDNFDQNLDNTKTKIISKILDSFKIFEQNPMQEISDKAKSIRNSLKLTVLKIKEKYDHEIGNKSKHRRNSNTPDTSSSSSLALNLQNYYNNHKKKLQKLLPETTTSNIFLYARKNIWKAGLLERVNFNNFSLLDPDYLETLKNNSLPKDWLALKQYSVKYDNLLEIDCLKNSFDPNISSILANHNQAKTNFLQAASDFFYKESMHYHVPENLDSNLEVKNNNKNNNYNDHNNKLMIRG